MAFDKSLLFKQRLDEDKLELEGFPDPIRLRSLNRDEVAQAQRDNTDPDTGEIDTRLYEYDLVVLSLVDPVLTVDEVEQWAAAAKAGEFVRVVEKIRDLSALGNEADKSRVRANRQERRAAVRNGSGRKAR